MNTIIPWALKIINVYIIRGLIINVDIERVRVINIS